MYIFLGKKSFKNVYRIFKFNCYFNSAHNHESFVNGASASYLEEMFNLWKADPKQVHASWDVYFRAVESGRAVGSAYIPPPTLSQTIGRETSAPTSSASTKGTLDEETLKEYLEVQSVTQSFRRNGHLAATLDPLRITRGEHLKLDRMQQHVFKHYKVPTNKDKMYLLHNNDYIGGGEKSLPLKEILQRFEAAYCGNIGVEYMYIGSKEKIDFIRQRFEPPGVVLKSITPQERKLILKRLLRAHRFEDYLSKKFPSEKRFGLEGGEVLIPAVKTMIDAASDVGVQIFHIGIAHRGRLNILANVVRKPLSDIFAQFRTLDPNEQGSGDVKYHLGTYVERVNSQTKKPVTVVVTANPSHLEAVNPVVVGQTYVRRKMEGDEDGNKVWSILIHGDAATTGQGVVYETFHLSELPCFTNYGSIHIIINNQIGFTTDPRMARSSEYCTEVAKVSSAPVFHVNGDDPDSVCYVMKVASEYKYKFKSDVVVDIVCYRRHGHSEADQPMFTQPLMYKVIAGMKPVSELYKEKMLAEGLINEADIQSMDNYSAEWLQDGFAKAQEITTTNKEDWLDSPWKKFFKPEKDPLFVPTTGVAKEVLLKIGDGVSTPPPDFDIHPVLVKILQGRKEMIDNNSVDWSLGESFAFGSLLNEGFNVRITGQDVERGTFSHRHHIYHHQSQDGVIYRPLHNIFPDGGRYTICNSSLSEFGVLGFQLGYSMVSPFNLVIWEAQFGDFCNSAQIMSDQFISSGESKWGRQVGLVMLLPHGLEGQGPEHSSARPERFLEMCAEPEPDYLDDMPQQLLNANWFLANPSTPANYFHILRRQLHLNFRKPLVIFSPKSTLRHPEARSSLDEMTENTMFKPYLKDDSLESSGAVQRVLLCTGKVFYELKSERKKRDLENKVAICRIEQLFPFPYGEVGNDLKQFPNAEIYWVQEEHRNQGWWYFVQPRLTSILGKQVNYAGRPTSAVPSTGSKVTHLRELQEFLDDSFMGVS